MPSRLEMDATARAWLIKTARSNLWRVATWYDLDELIADGALCWQIVIARYAEHGGRYRPRSQLMALFKTTYTNHIHRLANRRTNTGQADEEPVDLLPEQPCLDADIRLSAVEAPAAVGALLRAIIDRPELLKRPERHWLGGRRETTNEWLCRLIGLDPKDFNLHSQVLAFLGPLKAHDA